MAKWKRQKPKQERRVQFLRFNEDEVKDLVVSDWDFQKKPSGSLFKCYVVKENDEEVDKVWNLWDYDAVQKLKKKLGVKHVTGQKEIKVSMHRDEEGDVYFQIH